MDAIRMPNNHLHLAIAVNAFLRLYDLRPLENGQQMQRLCEVHQQILIYKLKHYFERGACFIMVADIMKSLTIYTLRDEFGSKQLQLFCRDPYGQWCMEMEPLGNEMYLATDSKSNLLVLKKKPLQMRRTHTTLQTEDPKIFSIFASFWVGE
mmetsp:Transcript_40099/g.38620  ORF Transcript_40099/g.38620 Transcript_40099/m.38620 type:complete len:152 (-) Transcript_40099:582-1037(-)